MALPPTVSTFTLTGTILKPDGTPRSGTIEVRVPEFRVPASDVFVTGGTLSATLDASGHFSLVLPNVADPDVQPQGLMLAVTTHLDGTRDARTFGVVPLAGTTTLDLADVVPTAEAPATTWTAIASGATNLDGLSDVDGVTGLAAGKALIYDGSLWKPTSIPSPSLTLDALTDVVSSGASTPTDGQVLVYDAASSSWKPGTISGSGGGSAGYEASVATLYPWLNAVRKGKRGATTVWASNGISTYGDMSYWGSDEARDGVPVTEVSINTSTVSAATDRYGYEWDVALKAGTWRMTIVCASSQNTTVWQGVLDGTAGSLAAHNPAGSPATATFSRAIDLGAFTVAADKVVTLRVEAGCPTDFASAYLTSATLYKVA